MIPQASRVVCVTAGTENGDQIKATEWPDGFGFDVVIGEQMFRLTWIEWKCLQHIVRALRK